MGLSTALHVRHGHMTKHTMHEHGRVEAIGESFVWDDEATVVRLGPQVEREQRRAEREGRDRDRESRRRERGKLPMVMSVRNYQQRAIVA